MFLLMEGKGLSVWHKDSKMQ